MAQASQRIEKRLILEYRFDSRIGGHHSPGKCLGRLGLKRTWSFFERRRRVDSESRHSADELGRNLSCAAEFRGNEDEHLPCRHTNLALMRCLDAKLTGAPAHFGGPKIEGEPVAITGRLGKIDREVH